MKRHLLRGSLIESGQGQQGQRTELVAVLSVQRDGACPQLLKRLDSHLEGPIVSRDRKVEHCVLMQHGWPGEGHLHIDVLGLRRGRITDSEVDGESFGVDREPHGLARPPLAAGAASAISSVVTQASAISSPAKLAQCGAQLDRLGREHGAQVISRPICRCDVLGREDDAHVGTFAVKVAIVLFTLEIDLPDPRVERHGFFDKLHIVRGEGHTTKALVETIPAARGAEALAEQLRDLVIMPPLRQSLVHPRLQLGLLGSRGQLQVDSLHSASKLDLDAPIASHDDRLHQERVAFCAGRKRLRSELQLRKDLSTLGLLRTPGFALLIGNR